MEREYDIAIIGGGAAGLTAAIFATAEAPAARVAVFDGAARLGAKILISGGGRCNVTHEKVTPDDFNGNRNSIARVLRSFPVDRTVAWFETLGVALRREESGKLFPASGRAATVLDALVHAAAGAAILTRHRVTNVRREADRFLLECDAREPVTAARVVLATGGRSVPKTGSDGHGFTIARSLGHDVTPLFPALVPLVLERGHALTGLSGVSADVELALRSTTGRVLLRHGGSLLFTHFGLSGPVVLDLSRHWIAARLGGEPGVLTAAFLPGQTFQSLEGAIVAAAEQNPRATAASFLRGRVPERVADVLATLAGLEAGQPLAALTRDARRAFVRAVIELPLPVTADRGFDYAEVTAGGVPLAEIDPGTMSSRRCSGLYLCGEVLDVDGRIGGFNFQWAWASGRLAGLGSALALQRRE